MIALLGSVAAVATAEPGGAASVFGGADDWKVGTPRRLDLAAGLSVDRRLDAPPRYELDGATSLGGGLDLRLFLARRFAIGAGWERFGVGHEQTGITPFGYAAIDRSADAFWLHLRIDPIANDDLAAYVAVAAGAALQRARAVGATWPALQPGLAQPLVCSGGGSPAPGFRIDLGGEARVAAGLRFFAVASFAVVGFGDGPLDDCIEGAGSSQLLVGRAGLSYAFDFDARTYHKETRD